LEIDASRVIDQLFALTEEPDFAAVYRQSYGLEDRFNATRYSHFDQSRARSARCKYTWLYLYICLWNSFALFTEKQQPSRAGAKTKVSETEDLYKFSHFCLTSFVRLASITENNLTYE
jgi:hypothetical protein